MSVFSKIVFGFALTVGITVQAQEVMTDHDGNEYRIVQFGERWIMAENYAGTKFRNGDPIPFAKDEEAWKQAIAEGSPAYCKIDGGGDGYEEASGYLYNWFVINDPRSFGPEGWHVTTRSELRSLLLDGGGVYKKDLCRYYYSVIEHDWKKVQKLSTKEKLNINNGQYQLLINASGFRSTDGEYRTPTEARLLVAEHDYVFSFDDNCLEIAEIGRDVEIGCSERFVRD